MATKKPSGKKSTAKNSAPAKALSPQAVVEKFFDYSNAMDTDAALGLIADNCVYQNVPFHKSVGLAKIRRDMELMTKTIKELHIETLNIAVNGNVVLTERIDTLAGPGFRVELPVMGAFVVKNGKISEWRDYLDWSFLLGHIVKGVATSPMRLLAERLR